MNGLFCVICGVGPGPEAGLYIRGHYVCPGCEDAITGLLPGDSGYEFYRNGLKRIWR